jgi:hypothetical protein
MHTYMQKSGQLHSPAALRLEKRPPVPTEEIQSRSGRDSEEIIALALPVVELRFLRSATRTLWAICTFQTCEHCSY